MCDTDVCSLYKICAVIECVTPHDFFLYPKKGARIPIFCLKMTNSESLCDASRLGVHFWNRGEILLRYKITALALAFT